jgi:hypothetical protein
VLNVYTMEQVYAFEDAAHRNVAEDLAEMATAFRAAGHPKDTVWKKYMEHLNGRMNRGMKKAKRKSPAVMTRAQAAELRKMSTRRAN